ncbi:hypothetical protein RFI_12066 [Reticulomyxa filosa]|uniref:Uncharacterized protein n=1 Tax=Reticulomyxa filosa TaxID=46433 RepID=X6NGF2_RETFI|nr:hypothetical protein RFI_12066 [Reticulomyxa filosa]|eukprot:ETO25076.1 hypothetical protein RFI_12066 [Reticulomyxa filosa]
MELFVCDVDNSKQIQSLNGHSYVVYCVKFSSYHYQNYCQNVICSSSDDKIIRFWDLKHPNYVSCVSVSPLQSNNSNDNNKDKSVRLLYIRSNKQSQIFTICNEQ